MGNVEGSIEALTQAILGEAKTETEDLHKRAEEQAELIRLRAREAAGRESSAILDQAKEEVRRLHGQKVATAQMKARSLELEHREQWLEKTFEAAAKRLQEISRRKDYGAIAAQLARESILQLKAPAVELRMDDVTRGAISKGALEDLGKETGSQLSIGQALESGTGVFAVTADGRLHFDNTLETRLKRIQGAIRSSVHRVLLGESE
jgi:vacuolar-type H+-ATPase subunit E/Vma4